MSLHSLPSVIVIAFFTLVASTGCTPGDGADAGDGDADAGDGDAGDGDAGDADGGPSCELTDDERGLVEEAILEAIIDAQLVGSHARADESAFALSLLGSGAGRAGFAFLIGPCVEPSSFVPYCDEGDGVSPGEEPGDGQLRPGQAVCTQFVCEAAGIALNHVWFAEEGHTEIDDEHPFPFTAVAPAGEGVYDPNPFRTWRADLTEEGRATITAALDHHVVITPASGPAIDASHVGLVTAVRVEQEPEDQLTLTLELSFTALADGPLTVVAGVDEAGAVTGTVSDEGTAVATLEGSFAGGAPALSWSIPTCP